MRNLTLKIFVALTSVLWLAWSPPVAAEPATGPAVTFVAPTPGQAAVAGQDLAVEIEVTGFELREPPPHSHHGHHGDSPAPAGGGHYHLYLNEAAGSDFHVTAWTPKSVFPLPADLAAGTHTLRIELRDDHHKPIGIQQTVTFTVGAAR